MNSILASNWRQQTSLGVAIFNGGLVAQGNYLLYVGGQTDAGASGVVTISRCKIDNDGTLGTWDTTAGILPIVHNFTRPVMYGNVLAIAGVPTTTPQGSILKGSIDANGNVINLVHSHIPATMSNGTRAPEFIVTPGGVVFYVGGAVTANYNGDEVWSAKLVSEIELNWHSVTKLPAAIQNGATVVYGDYLYYIGGSPTGAAAGAIGSIYSAKIEADGSLGVWTFVGSMPAALWKHNAVVHKDKVIIVGGQDTSSNYPTTLYVAKLERNGKIGPFSTEAAGAPVAGRLTSSIILNNRLYVAGGSAASKTATVWCVDLGR